MSPVWVCNAAFPTEEQVKAQLHTGMTPAELVATFGNPNSGVAETCINCTFKYIPPIGTLNVDHEGYIGFVVDFRDGKVNGWRIMTGYPSYAPPKMPRGVKIWLWIFPIMFGIGMILRFILPRTPVAWEVAVDVAEAFAAREIRTAELPSEFRFITHETTLREVLEKLGKPSRTPRVAINPNLGFGYALASSGMAPAITTIEYDLPYNAAVIIIPEFPFELENRIRAVYYRPIQQDLAAESE